MTVKEDCHLAVCGESSYALAEKNLMKSVV